MDLDIGAASLQWVPSAYVLTYGGLLLLGGQLADQVGRRRMFVVGLVLFATMSLVCGLAPTTEVLIVARCRVWARLMALRAVRESHASEAARSYDVLGAVSSAAGLLLLVFAITQLAEPTMNVAVVAAAHRHSTG